MPGRDEGEAVPKPGEVLGAAEDHHQEPHRRQSGGEARTPTHLSRTIFPTQAKKMLNFLEIATIHFFF